MRDFAKISPQIWINERGGQLKQLGIQAQLIAFYLSTNPHATMIGIYYLPITFIAHETGIKTEDVVSTLQQLKEINYCSYDEATEYIWIHDMAFEQMGATLKINDNRVVAINDTFHGLPTLPFLKHFFEKYGEAFHIRKPNAHIIEAPSESLSSKEKEKEKENEKDKNNKEADLLKNDDDFVCFEKNNKTYEQPQSDLNSVEVKEKALRILTFFNERLKYPYYPSDKNLQIISKYLSEGYTEKTCFQVIANQYRIWKSKKTKPYFKLIDIFGEDFPNYVSKLPIPTLNLETNSNATVS